MSGTFPLVFSVTSGKGGVGKTNISVNLAICLAQLGKQVVLIDADLGLANVDVVLGLAALGAAPGGGLRPGPAVLLCPTWASGWPTACRAVPIGGAVGFISRCSFW